MTRRVLVLVAFLLLVGAAGANRAEAGREAADQQQSAGKNVDQERELRNTIATVTGSVVGGILGLGIVVAIIRRRRRFA